MFNLLFFVGTDSSGRWTPNRLTISNLSSLFESVPLTFLATVNFAETRFVVATSNQQAINTVLVNLGNADVVKAQLLTKHEEAQADWKEMTTELEKKYGNVNISLEDGSISAVKEKEGKA